MSTIGLNTSTWDIALDSSGNWQILSDGQDVAQDVASAIKLFLGELYYDVTAGVPYFNDVFGPAYTSSVVENLLELAALTVPAVAVANVTITKFDYLLRLIVGTVAVATTAGQNLTISFGG